MFELLRQDMRAFQQVAHAPDASAQELDAKVAQTLLMGAQASFNHPVAIQPKPSAMPLRFGLQRMRRSMNYPVQASARVA